MNDLIAPSSDALLREELIAAGILRPRDPALTEPAPGVLYLDAAGREAAARRLARPRRYLDSPGRA